MSIIKTVLKKIIVTLITLEARAVLRKYKPEIVAVTGSVGKTGTKDAIYAVLSRSVYAHKGEKSFNSEVGIPLTILRCESAWGSVVGWIKIISEGLGLIFLKNHYPKTLVVEVGTDRTGDIWRITLWMKPDIVVVTAFPEVPAHIEFFLSREALIEEKMHLPRALKAGGLLALNADDDDVYKLKQLSLHNTLTFGKNAHADVLLFNQEIEYNESGRPIGMFGKVGYRGNKLPLHLKGVLGAHMFYPALAGLAVGIGKGINIVKGVESLEAFVFPPGRMRLLDGIHESVIIDDSYNSSPAAVHAALDVFSDIKKSARASDTEEGRRKIAVLGDMLELGKYSAEEHKKVGARIPEICDILITVGIRAQCMAEAAHRKKMKKANMYHFDNSIRAGEFLKEFLRNGDIVLIKGSQSMRMERAVERILNNPADRKLLVRQEKEWFTR